jgi:ANTAR domain-containing protein
VEQQELRDEVRTRLRSVLTSTHEVEDYLQRALEDAAELLDLEASYTLSTVLYENPYTVATTDRAAWEADQIEFDADDGPCVEVLGEGTVHPGIDLRTERRWPAWSAVAELLGFTTAVALGTELEPGQRLVLNGYSTSEAFLDESATARTQLFLDELGFTLPIALRVAEQSTELAQLQQALASRSTIDQALGILMAQNRCSRDEAFGILRRASQNRNIKLRDVASALIERATGHPVAPPPRFRPAAPTR